MVAPTEPNNITSTQTNVRVPPAVLDLGTEMKMIATSTPLGPVPALFGPPRDAVVVGPR